MSKRVVVWGEGGNAKKGPQLICYFIISLPLVHGECLIKLF